MSSSAHVVVAEKLMGLDPSSPSMTLLLVMLHTGTMFAVIVYFWRQWRSAYFQSAATFKIFAGRLLTATLLTGVIGEVLIKVIEKTAFRDSPNGEIEDLFSYLELVAPALAIAGALILVAGIYERRDPTGSRADTSDLSMNQAGIIGAVQGLCLPFRGFSRSGATISTGILLGLGKSRAEMFSFALAVILTPPLSHVKRCGWRARSVSTELFSWRQPRSQACGTVLAFLAGLVALKWLSRWLERGSWYISGLYCLGASLVVAAMSRAGY